jgi:hypothetical protein
VTGAANCPCHDCGRDTLPTDWGSRAEWYMVHDHVWAAAGMDGMDSGFLCIGCLEARLGRRLTPGDFIAAKLHDLSIADDDYAWSYRTPRLLARLTGQPLEVLAGEQLELTP